MTEQTKCNANTILFLLTKNVDQLTYYITISLQVLQCTYRVYDIYNATNAAADYTILYLDIKYFRRI